MSQSMAMPGSSWIASEQIGGADRLAIPDARRRLQLALAAIWLLDGILQFQSFMFSRGFSQMLARTSSGNPALIADPIAWAARVIGQHAAGTDAAFGAAQVLLGLGIACRPTVRAALAASIAWAIAVWWLGEGLGGIVDGTASPVNGAPGAVILYALLAVLLWPPRTAGSSAAPFVAARPVGPAAARVLWLALWGSLAYFAVTAANRSAQGLHDMVASMASGEPGWLAAVNRGAADLLAHRGLSASIVFAVLLAVIAVGVLMPPPLARITVGLAIIVALVIWVAGQDLGTILTGGATDPNSGLLLVLLSFAYRPVTPAATTSPQPANSVQHTEGATP